MDSPQHTYSRYNTKALAISSLTFCRPTWDVQCGGRGEWKAERRSGVCPHKRTRRGGETEVRGGYSAVISLQ